MPANFYRTNQAELLEMAKVATKSQGWKGDAVAFGMRFGPDQPPAAVVVFQRFFEGEAEMHFAMMGNHVMGRELVEGILLVAFHRRMLGLHTLYTPVAVSNVRAQIAALKVGFLIEHRKPAIRPGEEDAIVFAMRRWEASGQTAVYETQDATQGG